jgi:hypothetical protein
MSIRTVAAWAALALAAGCASKPAPAPSPVARPVPAPPPAPAAPVETAQDWRDIDLTPGDWSYSGNGAASEARFPGFSLRCDRGRRQVILSRDGAKGTLRVRTTYGERGLPPGAALAADDALLDEIAFSRGRFTVEAEGVPMLVVPAWPEPARVVEDCRA